MRKQRELHVCKCSNNAGPHYLKVLHEAHVSVISILQNHLLYITTNSTQLTLLPAFRHYTQH